MCYGICSKCVELYFVTIYWFIDLLNDSANMSLSLEELLSMLDEKIKFGISLGEKLQDIVDVDGTMKLQRKIRQEIQFLKRVRLRWTTFIRYFKILMLQIWYSRRVLKFCLYYRLILGIVFITFTTKVYYNKKIYINGLKFFHLCECK